MKNKYSFRKKLHRAAAAFLAVTMMLLFAVMPGTVQQITQKSLLLQMMTDIVHAAITAAAAASDFTVEEVLAWLRSNEGKALDPDGAYGAQCVDAVDALMEFMGINWRNYLVNGAKDFAWRSIPDGWARYQGVQPEPGDILIYTGSGYGHVAIYESDYCTWHQNFNGHGYLERVTSQRYDAWGYWGVLRPNYKVPEPPKPTEKQGSAMAKSSGQMIPDGIYWVHSALSQTARLDLTGENNSEIASPSPAQMWSEKKLPGYDAFKIKYNENGWYTISPVDSSLCLDVNGASLSEKTKVQFYTANGTTAQDWSIESTDTGYILRARCNGFVLTVADSACPNGTELMTCEESGSKTQRWCFIPAETDAGNLPQNTDCFLRSAGGKCGLAADENGAVSAAQTASRWILRLEDDGSCTVTEKHTGLVLGIDISADDHDYIRSKGVCLAENTGVRSQHWILMHTRYGTALVSQLNGFCLTMNDDGSISTAFRSGSEAQSWNIESAKAPKTLAGDLNCDGAVTVTDAILMARIVAESTVTVSETGLSNADMDCNDMLDANDTVLILKAIAKMPIEVWVVDDGSFSALCYLQYFNQSAAVRLVERGNDLTAQLEDAWSEYLNLAEEVEKVAASNPNYEQSLLYQQAMDALYRYHYIRNQIDSVIRTINFIRYSYDEFAVVAP